MFRFIIFAIPLLAALWVYTKAKNRGQSVSGAALWAVVTFALLTVLLPLYPLFIIFSLLYLIFRSQRTVIRGRGRQSYRSAQKDYTDEIRVEGEEVREEDPESR